ncbi:MAG TPA: aldehyde dehydrogenase family protein [Thermoleophilia bacterium]|nr:aldehyde dehydrogenase family protein [Thermoleophilia bacterium]
MSQVVGEYRNAIAGDWVESESGARFEDRNPATGELIATFPRSTAADADRAVAAAHEAYQSWRLVPAPKRAEILFRVAEILRDDKRELTELMTREMGKVVAEAGGDVQEGIDMTYYMAGEGRRMFGQTVPAEMPNKFAMSVRQPMGVVAVITPFNFPMAIPTWKLMPALVTGNTAVFKPAEDTPLLAAKLMEIFERAGLPAGVVNVVNGPGEVVGQRLLEHPDVKVISFTGSKEVGIHVATTAARTLKRVHLELGGKNAIIVMDDANLENAAEGILWSAFGTSGQRCTAASRVIVHERVYGRLAAILVERAEGLRIGDGLDPSVQIGPLINAAALEKVHRYTGIGRDEGATILTGGEPVTGAGEGYFYRPTIFGDVERDMRVATEEIFGPATSLIRCRDLDDAIAISNRVEYGLSSAIYTDRIDDAFRAIRDLDTGITYINAGTIGAEIQLPFGGTKYTGNGHREAGQAALDTYTEWKSVYVDYSGRLQRAQIDNQ